MAHAVPLSSPQHSVPSFLNQAWDTMQPVVRGIGRIIPVVISVLAVKNVVINSIDISHRLSYKIIPDIRKYWVSLVENTLRFMSCILSQINLYLSLAKAALPQVVSLIIGVVSTLLSSLFFIWNIFKNIQSLQVTYRIRDVLDKALNKGSDEEKVRCGLEEFEKTVQERRILMEQELAKVGPLCVEKARKLIEVDTEQLLEEKFGKHTYKLLEKAAQETTIEDKLKNIRAARVMLRVKEVSHWLEIVASVAALAAMIFECLFPAFGLIAIAGWMAWSIAGSGWASGLLLSLIMDKKVSLLLKETNITPRPSPAT